MGDFERIDITNGSDDRLRKAISKALLRFHAANRGNLDALQVTTAAAIHLVDAAWHGFQAAVDPKPTPEMFAEVMRLFGEQIARGEHIAPRSVQ